jgi:capsid protein
MKALQNIIDGAKVSMFGYDALVDKKRRKAPTSATSSEDRTLANGEKRKAQATVRDMRRNYGLAAWMIRKHLDYVSDFRFCATTKDKAYNEQLESLMRWWSRPQNCDIAGRHSLSRYVRLAEAMRTVDGDIGTLLLKSGKIQAIEGDRIGKPSAGAIPVGSMTLDRQSMLQNGVLTNGQGRATNYVLLKRKVNSSSLEFDKVVRARNLKLLAYYDRFDQVRGISPLMTAIKTNTDIDEVQEYQRVKQKVSSLFGTVIERDQVDDDDGFDYTSDGETTPKYDYTLKTGMKLELNKGDKLDLVESKTPGGSFIDFQTMSIHLALLSLDIPMSFFDSSQTSYSSRRSDVLDYQRSSKTKQADLIGFLDGLTAWKIAQWEAQGLLPARPVEGADTWIWRPCGIPWIDPLKEVNAYNIAINNGLLSRREAKNLMGCSDQPLEQTFQELSQEEAMAVEQGITLTVGMPGAPTTRDEEVGNEANQPTADEGVTDDE